LEAFICIKPLDDSNDKWRQWSCQAYLHLPAEFASLNVVPAKVGKREVGVHAHGAQIIHPEVLQDLSNHDSARLTNAMRVLHLEADIHPMTFSPQISSDQRGKGSDDIQAAKDARGKALEGMQWPMRIQVTKMLCRTDGADDCFKTSSVM
jgi:hypothetical protein